jgi:hypothetical protein
MPTTLRNTDILFNDSTTQSTAYGPTDVQTFNSTGTWTKPTGRSMARIQVWAGGGGGSRTNQTDANGGGGGGGYNEMTVPLSYLASTVTATVGAGGAGATTTADGGVGGISSFALATAYNGRSSVEATGGRGGERSSIPGIGNGGPGGGPGPSGFPTIPQFWWQGGRGGSAFCSGSPSGGAAVWAGAGGGLPSAVAANQVSLYGGAGGINAVGTQPAGGGGCSSTANVNGSSGAAGRIVVTSW